MHAFEPAWDRFDGCGFVDYAGVGAGVEEVCEEEYLGPELGAVGYGVLVEVPEGL